jgi:hypothetical protein
VRKAENLPPSSADVTESGSLNLPEPSGPHRPVMGMLYMFWPIWAIINELAAVRFIIFIGVNVCLAFTENSLIMVHRGRNM